MQAERCGEGWWQNFKGSFSHTIRTPRISPMALILRCKVVLAGDGGVGKSALTQMFQSNGAIYPKNYIMTIPVDFCVKEVAIPECDTAVELYLFDCAGNPLFKEAAVEHWSDASMIMLVYDVTNESSFDHCVSWLEEFAAARPEGTISGCVVANKIDLVERAVVASQRGAEFARNHGLAFFETSAAAGNHVEDPFVWMAKSFQKVYEERREMFSHVL